MGSFSGHHGFIFGSSWDHFWIIMGAFSGHHGFILAVILGSCFESSWVHFLVITNSFGSWGHFWESSWAHFEDHHGIILGFILVHFGIILASLWLHFWIMLGLMLKSFWDHFGFILGHSCWDHSKLVPSWRKNRSKSRSKFNKDIVVLIDFW